MSPAVKLAVGVALGLLVGMASAALGLPCPAPPAFFGAGLVASMTLGYVACDRLFARGEQPPPA